jgi:arginyl-tRNA synthetase
MITQDIKSAIQKALGELGIQAETILLEHPADLAHGDYSTNVALAYAKQAGKNPRALAEEIVVKLDLGITTEIAGAGFINFRLPDTFFAEQIKNIGEQRKAWGTNTLIFGKKVMVEYTQPNPFKPFHIGHLMSNAIGESVSRIVEASGAKTVRANYQGDIGPHVAKAIWALMKKGLPEKTVSVMEQANYIGVCYAEGSDAYENDAVAKEEIDVINKKVYERSDAAVNDIYDWGRKVTLEAFEQIYATLGTKFDYYFFESEMAPIGAKIVKDNVPAFFQESDGAIVFKAETYDPKLHTRVFINSKGLPTYETKELGLTVTKFEKENPDISIITTAIEQGEYMKVVQKAVSLIHPDYEKRMKHVTHGMMRFASGKMSSRKGNVVTGESLLRDVQDVVLEKMADRELSTEEKNTIAAQVGVAALKYSILKQALGGDIIYDFEKSISFEGDSGPYLQYTCVRARAVLEKARAAGIVPDATLPEGWHTTSLEKYLYRFPELVQRAYEELEPHHITTYLTELASLFNSFYGQEKIVDASDVSSAYKLALTQAFLTTMINGLYVLGIVVPEKM